MRDLPQIVETTRWSWTPFDSAKGDRFWVGTDDSGNQWLTKLRGPNRAYRDIVFCRVAQTLGWSCQSTVLVRVDSESAKLLGVESTSLHGAHWLFQEHDNTICKSNCCPLKSQGGIDFDHVDELALPGIAHLLDYPRSILAAHLFGASEPPGHLISSHHEFVIVDTESMFSADPAGMHSFHFLDHETNPRGMEELAVELCRQVVDLSQSDLDWMLSTSCGVAMENSSKVAARLYRSRKVAQEFLLRPFSNC